jgi:glutaredoxin 3
MFILYNSCISDVDMGIVFKNKCIFSSKFNVLKSNKMNKLIGLLILFLGVFSVDVSAQEIQKETQKSKVVIVYGSDECHHCTDTKAFLKENHIDFVFYDIDKNQEALKEMLTKLRNANISTSNLGIPVVDKQGIIFTNNGVFEDFLKKLK